MLEFVDQLCGDFFDHVVRNRQDDYIGIREGRIGIHACYSQLLQPVASRFADLDVANLVGGILQVCGYPISYLPASANNRFVLKRMTIRRPPA